MRIESEETKIENTVKELKLEELEMVNGGDFLDIVGGFFGGGMTGALIGLVAGPVGVVVGGVIGGVSGAVAGAIGD